MKPLFEISNSVIQLPRISWWVGCNKGRKDVSIYVQKWIAYNCCHVARTSCWFLAVLTALVLVFWDARMCKICDLNKCILHVTRYMRRQHLVDVTEIFNRLNREKKQRLFKLFYLLFLLIVSIVWYCTLRACLLFLSQHLLFQFWKSTNRSRDSSLYICCRMILTTLDEYE